MDSVWGVYLVVFFLVCWFFGIFWCGEVFGLRNQIRLYYGLKWLRRFLLVPISFMFGKRFLKN